MKHIIVIGQDSIEPIQEVEAVDCSLNYFNNLAIDKKHDKQEKLARHFAKYLSNNCTRTYLDAFIDELNLNN